MKKRFLIVGDNHLDSKNPQSRLDNYMESSLMKLKETLMIAKAAKVDYYILLGDVFDRIEVGGYCRNRVLEILATDEGETWPFKKYVCIGNHDIAHNPSFIGKSALQTLISANVVTQGSSESIEGVSFYHFTPELDQQLLDGVLTHDPSKILFLHASITDKPSRFTHVLFKDLPLNNSTKLVVSGHIHSPMESTKNGVKFFNPGCIGRSNIDEKHDPQVLLIQFDYGTNECVHKYLKLKCALSHEVIFDLEKNNQKKFENKNTELFIESVTETNINDSITSDIEKDFRTFAAQRNVENKVIEIVANSINIIKTGGTL